ncbi:MAG: hypothetical protein KAS72_08185 [Phycisphaerales bacterium]|nr:hypothetical protein [Phycisphaerales bacterium]
MSAKRESVRLLGAVGLVVALAGSATATMPAAERVAAAEAELDAARTEMQQQKRDEQMNLLVDQAVQDAADRSFYLQDTVSVTHTPGKGLLFSDSTGANTLQISFRTQFRYIFNFQTDDDANVGGNVDGTSEGFEFRRNRVLATGTMKEKIGYKVQADFGPMGGFTLLDTYFDYELDEGWSIRAGQFILPFNSELLCGSYVTQAVERSHIDGLFGAGRSQGVMVTYTQEEIMFRGSFNDGMNSNNTDWNSDANEMAFTARVDWMPFGEWAQFCDYTSNRESEEGLKVGVAMHYQDGDPGDAATPTSLAANGPNVWAWTIDGQFEWPGANLYASVNGLHVYSETAGVADTDNFGFVVGGGYYVTDDTEIFGRWEYMDIDGMSDEPMIFTFGANKYIDGHANKFTVDFGFTTENVPLGLNSDRVALEVDAAGEDFQLFARGQWQLMF